MSYTALDHCFYCGKSTTLLFDRQLREDAFPGTQKISTSYEPCNACTANMATGFTLIEAIKDKGPTGNYWVIKQERANEIFTQEFLDSCTDNKAFVTPDDAITIGLRPEESTNED